MPGKKGQYNCKQCGSKFTARVADRKRGWARFCSKSCKAIFQSKRRFKRHDGVSQMKHKRCCTCGDPAINGVYLSNGQIEWGCELHHQSDHHFSSDALGQW